MMKHGLATLVVAALSASQADAFVPAPRARGWQTPTMNAEPMNTEMVTVPIPGLDGRETKLQRHELDMLKEVREILPGRHGRGVGGTHVVFLPGKGQDSTAFDTALGSLGVLGLHAMCAGMPSKNWDETTGRIKQTIGAIKEHMKEKHSKLGDKGVPPGKKRRQPKGTNWSQLFDNEMLSWSLHPVFSQLEKESSTAGLPACDHLLLVGCGDGAWVLQAFLCELDRLGLKPRLDISMVALGSKSDSLIAKAVTAVYPDRLSGVRYLSVHGSLPSRRPEDEGGEDDKLDDVLTADLDNSDFYGYGYSREAMTCITSVDGMTEECILSSPGAGFDGSIEAWYSSPATIVRWIVKCIL